MWVGAIIIEFYLLNPILKKYTDNLYLQVLHKCYIKFSIGVTVYGYLHLDIVNAEIKSVKIATYGRVGTPIAIPIYTVPLYSSIHNYTYILLSDKEL